MKRLFVLVAAFVAVTSGHRTASAQFGFNQHAPMGETIQKERQDQLSQQQKYAHSTTRSTAPSVRFQPSGRHDSYGRMDLSGRAAPGYPTIRDESFKFGQSRSLYTQSRRRTTSHKRTSRSHLRIPPPPPIR